MQHLKKCNFSGIRSNFINAKQNRLNIGEILVGENLEDNCEVEE